MVGCSDPVPVCSGCGWELADGRDPLVAGHAGWYCANDDCDRGGPRT